MISLKGQGPNPSNIFDATNQGILVTVNCEECIALKIQKYGHWPVGYPGNPIYKKEWGIGQAGG